MENKVWMNVWQIWILLMPFYYLAASSDIPEFTLRLPKKNSGSYLWKGRILFKSGTNGIVKVKIDQLPEHFKDINLLFILADNDQLAIDAATFVAENQDDVITFRINFPTILRRVYMKPYLLLIVNPRDRSLIYAKWTVWVVDPNFLDNLPKPINFFSENLMCLE